MCCIHKLSLQGMCCIHKHHLHTWCCIYISSLLGSSGLLEAENYVQAAVAESMLAAAGSCADAAATAVAGMGFHHTP